LGESIFLVYGFTDFCYAPDWAKAFSWFMVLPIFVMTLIDMMMGG